MAAEAARDPSKPYIPLAGAAEDGYTKNDRATATCQCGTVQLEFPTEGDGLVETFLCHCTDCRKITASMFASNFIVKNDTIKHIRGQEKLTVWSQKKTIESGNAMANYFCSVCGTLMYRLPAGIPGVSVMRIGTVDDFNLHETKLKPRIEQFTKDRVTWLKGAEGVTQEEGNYLSTAK